MSSITMMRRVTFSSALLLALVLVTANALLSPLPATSGTEMALAVQVHTFLGNDPAQWRSFTIPAQSVSLAATGPTSPAALDASPDTHPLLLFATYLGGQGKDESWAIAVDKHGNTYLSGDTQSLEMRPSGQSQDDVPGNIFVARLDSAGHLVYVTILGGSSAEEGNAIGVDDFGNAYVTGETFSPDFPVKDAWQSHFAGYEDAYLAKLDPTGALVFSTFFGGARAEEVNDIYVDAVGNAYLGGEVYSDDFPLLNPWSANVYGSDEEDGFLTIFNAEGEMVYSTLFSGPQRDQVFRIAVDDEGYVYGAGMTSSPDFPTVNPVQADYGGGWDDALLFKFDPWNNEMLYCTFLGGADRDEFWGLAVDAEGAAYVAGFTTSPDYPVVNAHQPVSGGYYEAVVSKFSPSGDRLLFSTFLGGPQRDMAEDLAIDSGGNVYVVGYTSSPGFLTRNALQPLYGGGEEDGFMVVMSSEGTPLYASFMGGSGVDRGRRITVDHRWVAHIAGHTTSPDLPLLLPVQAYGGQSDVLFARYGLIPTPTPTPTPVPTPTPTPFATTQVDARGGVVWVSWPEHLTILRVPREVFHTPMQLTLTYALPPHPSDDLLGIDHAFSIAARPSTGGAPLTTFPQPLELELAFPPAQPLISGTVGLYHFLEPAWSTATLTLTHLAPGHLLAEITRTGTYSILGQTHAIYLPLTLRH